ncbi:hypothetical protein CFELI_08965 [Corynebacterium felinum]|uniref:Uncharacterized protein n=1 Tax=Corynebacterium felinum TaxID=131318 RepID=A0ABU2BBT8_9CORY|nr:hypothetical protein [Corynebacterium felinum]WJY95398.1 hypothetical protein CFELI_08965 [Corynebacterium felinum]
MELDDHDTGSTLTRVSRHVFGNFACSPVLPLCLALAQIFHGVGLVVVGWGGVFVGLVGSPSPFDSWFLGQGVRP